MHFVDPAVIHHFFSEHDAKTKYKMATALSEWFEELSWKLPPERRVWQSERYSMVIFDAVGTAMAFMASESEEGNDFASGTFDGPSSGE